jgi:hypothetical protein
VTELPIQQILLDTVSVIERLNIPYAIMGGFAARAWGLPRPTFDAEIAIDVEADKLQSLFDALEAQGFSVPAEHRTGFLDVIGGFKKAQVNYLFDRHVWHTDLVVARGEFLTTALRRARPATIAGKPLRVMAPEDIIILKLIAKRRKDLADVEEIVSLCKDLDVDYLRDWAGRLSVGEALTEFLNSPQ